MQTENYWETSPVDCYHREMLDKSLSMSTQLRVGSDIVLVRLSAPHFAFGMDASVEQLLQISNVCYQAIAALHKQQAQASAQPTRSKKDIEAATTKRDELIASLIALTGAVT